MLSAVGHQKMSIFLQIWKKLKFGAFLLPSVFWKKKPLGSFESFFILQKLLKQQSRLPF